MLLFKYGTESVVFFNGENLYMQMKVTLKDCIAICYELRFRWHHVFIERGE